MTLLEFEEKYREKLENIKEWVFIRISVGYYLKNLNNRKFAKISKNYKALFINKIRKTFIFFKNSFFGFKNWFRKYDYIFISDSAERKLINGYYFDKFFDDFIDRLDRDKSLLIEIPINKHYKNSYTKYIVSFNLLKIPPKVIYIFFLLINKFIKLDIKKLEFKELLNILYLNQIYVNLWKIKYSFHSEYLWYKLILSIYSPKIIFVICSYCHISLVKAAKDLGIKVIEMQHGVISQEHFGYVSYLKLDKTFIPEEILVWQKIDYKNFLIPKQFILGHFYLDYLSKLDLKKYEGINIAVTMQDQDWEFFSLIEFIIDIAKENRDITFYLIRRRRNDFPALPENVKIIKDDCYITLLKCQYHMSIYSSCTIEAGYFNIPSILVDINRYATKYFGKYQGKFVYIIKNKNEFKNLIEDDIKVKEFDLIDKNYELNVRQVIKQLKNKGSC
jgi:hypothetical protein